MSELRQDKKYSCESCKIYFALTIFKAIFEIVDGIKTGYPLPDDLEIFVGKIRREVFYYEQSEPFPIGIVTIGMN